ncbi:hypothetical protein DDV21_010230 [Streptococcus chenjunshii]|uniref:HK97 gp10 family phage protein n=1 Tax=Streptococcus chenjunshii TaxID=2173853 RepID=A0A372KLR3_9STRE|nr:hypothetical protein [Streptococcus chenjunshii]AXQ79426.1 hypothetical protein DDV21_010230 [Streptococcus chenjunshii]RFU51117.1 hypothetical protein DDV22_05270 [Streptococcus chenjunshii]RFU53215.1 hypothetical protein DDV23_05780 [Streptococcus chenjunshii]
MASGAKLKGYDELIRNMEKKLGPDKVKRAVNKSLRETSKLIEPDFKDAVSSYKDTGATVNAVVISGVKRDMGIPSIKLGFTSPRWNLVHLQELGYSRNPSPRGFGVIRRFSNELEGVYPKLIAEKLKEEFGD